MFALGRFGPNSGMSRFGSVGVGRFGPILGVIRFDLIYLFI